MGKKLIFCSDGTWNKPKEKDEGFVSPTNVSRLYQALSRQNGQVADYKDGIGADGNILDRLEEGALGDGLFDKIKEGYRFLAKCHQEGDEIFLFWFSRGAYTARCLAGWLAHCGLTAPDDETALEASFSAYRQCKADPDSAMGLQETYATRDCILALVGVWDTVGSLGIPGALFKNFDEELYGFLDTGLHPDILHACHAVAIDEMRDPFKPTLWPADDPRVEQVWFSGVHCNVGGGYADAGLSDITLKWMVDKAKAQGLAFDETQLNLSPNPLGVIRDSAEGFWQALGTKPRDIDDAPSTRIASSVKDRVSTTGGTYKPANLKINEKPTPMITGSYSIISI